MRCCTDIDSNKSNDSKECKIGRPASWLVPRSDTVTEPHWLPIAVRVEFNILLLVHRALNGGHRITSPIISADVCHLDRCARVNLICFVSRELNGFGETDKSASQPRHCWNLFPQRLTLIGISEVIFKSQLKACCSAP